ncbi:MAG: hypothetical protein AABZ32_02850 [Bacteroidota bacterium]
MTKRLTTIGTVFLLTTSLSIGQVGFEIGKSSDTYVKQIIQYKVESYYSAQGTKSVKMSWDVKYNDGEISDVIYCSENQYHLDLKMIANFCTHYMMASGKLAYVLTQYENVSTDKLKSSYDNKYGDRKIGDKYFDEDYLNYSQVYLATNGYPTVEYKKTETYELPSDIKKKIEDKQKEQVVLEMIKKEAEETEKKKEKEIKSKLYDLEKYDKTQYFEAVNKQRDNLISCLQSISKSSGNPYSSYSSSVQFIPSFTELEKADKKYFIFKNSYTAYYYLKDNSTDGKNYGTYIVSGTRDIKKYAKFTLVSGEDKNCILLNNCYISIPTIKYEGYEVMTEATIKNIVVDYIKGVTTVKIKNGTVTYKKNPPPTEYQTLLSDKLKNEPKGGLYIVKYEVGKVMDKSFANTETKKTKSTGKKILRTTGIILLIAGALIFY